MTDRGMLLVGLSALLTVASNLMLRAGVIRAGGFGLSLGRLVSDLLRLARQPLFVTGLVLYATAALVWFRVISTENLNSSYPLLVSLTFVPWSHWGLRCSSANQSRGRRCWGWE